MSGEQQSDIEVIAEADDGRAGIGHRCSHSSHGSNPCVGYTEDRIFMDGIVVSVKNHQAS